MTESINLDGGRSRVRWVDVDLSDSDSRTWLESQPDLSEECRSALAHTPKISRRDNLDDGLCVSLCGFDPTEAPRRERPMWLRVFLREDEILTVRPGPMGVVDGIRRELEAGSGPTTPLHFVASLVVSAMKRLEPAIANLAEAIDDLEDRVLDSDSDPPLDDVDALRREVFRLRHHLVAVHNVLRLTIADPTVPLSGEEREALNDASELVERHLESLVDCRDRALLLHDKIAGQIAQNMAQATYNLTIIATVFLPLTFVTGLLGMNVSGIPESHDPAGFWIVVGALVVLAIAAWGFLRWKKQIIFG